MVEIIGTNAADTLYGGDQEEFTYISGLGGDDLIDVGYRNYYGASIDGGDGADTIWGGSGDDTIIGGDFDGESDTIYAGAGNDSIYAGMKDVIYAGVGNDVIMAAEPIYDAYIDGGRGIDALVLLSGYEYNIGNYEDIRNIEYLDIRNIYNGPVAVVLSSLSESDTAVTIAGAEYNRNSIVVVDDGDTEKDILITLGSGNDTVTLDETTHEVTVIGNGGDDSITTSIADDYIVAGSGNDIINAGAGADSVLGGSGNDIISTDAGADTIDAGDGDDIINAGTGADSVLGGSGNDTISTGTRRDTIDAGDGDDIVKAGIGNDSVKAGDGNDKVYAAKGNDIVWGGNGNDTLIGGQGHDKLYGDQGNDLLKGEKGDDTLDGGSGADKLYGGKGNDVLQGGTGNDTLKGGAGSDRFVYNDNTEGSDIIVDFKVNKDTFDWNGGLQAIDDTASISFQTIATDGQIANATTIIELSTEIASGTASALISSLGDAAYNNSIDVDDELLFVAYQEGADNAYIYNFVDTNDGDINAGELTLIATLNNVTTGSLDAGDFV